jgi:UDP-glucose/iron transport system ATP-binding protein
MPRLRVENLGLFHLNGIHLALGAGECLTLSGPSGAGKTLLLRAIGDLVPHTGEVFLDGRPANGFAPPDWRRQVGLLAAESRWWHDTVGPHFPRGPVSSLERFGFDETVMDWEVGRLSSGERQRLALVRLLCNRPAVLLLDEPTANLDADSTRRVEAVLDEYRENSGACLLWVTHDTRQIKRVADQNLLLEGGILREDHQP